MTESPLPAPIDPNYESRVRDSFGRQPFMSWLGASISALGPGACDIVIDRREELTQQHGYLHGAVIGALCDDAAAYAAYTLMAADSSLLAVEYKLNFIAPADGERIVARGRVERYGRTLSVCRVDVFAEKPGPPVLVTISQHTIIQLPKRPDRPS